MGAKNVLEEESQMTLQKKFSGLSMSTIREPIVTGDMSGKWKADDSWGWQRGFFISFFVSPPPLFLDGVLNE